MRRPKLLRRVAAGLALAAVLALGWAGAATIARTVGFEADDARAARAPSVCAGRGGRPAQRRAVDQVQTGVVTTRWTGGHRVIGCLGAGLVRIEFPIGTPVSRMRPTFASIARQGARILPLAGFHGELPTAAQARSLRAWAAEFGRGGRFWRGRPDGDLAIRDIEFGNETSYPYQYGAAGGRPAATAARARSYGRLAEVALDALEDTRVGLMVQAEEAVSGSDWVANMLGAAPGIAERVSAWTVHPYGLAGPDTVQRLIDDTRAAGAPDSVPVAITEWGVSSANGRCVQSNFGWNRCLRHEQAGRLARRTVRALAGRLGGRLRVFIVYASQDLDFDGPSREREEYFGVASVDHRAKGAYTRFARDLFAGRLLG